MEIETVHIGSTRLAGTVHTGPYERISESFIRLFPIADALSLSSAVQARYIAVYYDNPVSTPKDRLRGLAAVTVTQAAEIGELHEEHIEAGHYLRATFIGPHSELATGWQQLAQHINTRNISLRPGPSFEIYAPPPDEDHTELYVPTRIGVTV